MEYDIYSYHESNTSPTGDRTALLYGIELETDDFSREAGETLDFLIDTDIITCPDNEHRTLNLKKIENDSSVRAEIIIRADELEEVKNRIRILCDSIYQNGYEINNTSGTSAHIHINRAWLDAHGITQTNIVKMFELFAPLIYRISGRTSERFYHWAEPLTTIQEDRHIIDWERQITQVAEIDPEDMSGRYFMVNCSNYHTIELRAFSNYYNFNKRILCFYLDFVNKCVHLCEYMKGKLYRNEGKYLIRLMLEWIKNNYPYIWIKFNLGQINHIFPDIIIYRRNWENMRSYQSEQRSFRRYGDDFGFNSIMTAFQNIIFRYGLLEQAHKQVTLTPQGLNNFLERAGRQKKLTVNYNCGFFNSMYYLLKEDLEKVYL